MQGCTRSKAGPATDHIIKLDYSDGLTVPQLAGPGRIAELRSRHAQYFCKSLSQGNGQGRRDSDTRSGIGQIFAAYGVTQHQFTYIRERLSSHAEAAYR